MQKKSNIISFSLGSSETLTITAAKDTVVRSNPFTVTFAGNPNTPYLIPLDSAGRGTVPQMNAGQIGVTRGDAGQVVVIDGVPKSVLRPSCAAGDAKSWGVVVTASDGNRIVEYSTTPSGSPNGVAIFIFGANYYERVTTTVDNGRYDYKMYLPESMAAGQYYVVVEHPMYDGTFWVVELNANGQTILATLSPNGGIQSSFVVEGSNRLQGAQAANALLQMLASPYIDDIFTTMRLNVQGAYITITPRELPRLACRLFSLEPRTSR